MMARRQSSRVTVSGGSAVCHRHHPRCYHMAYLPLGRCTRLAWTTLRRRSPGQYVPVPGRAWNDHWSSRATQIRNNKLSKWLSSQVFPRYAGLDTWDLGDTPSPRLDRNWRRRGVDVSTPRSQTPTLNPTAMTLQESASIYYGAMATTDDTQDATTVARASAAREDPRTPGNDRQVDPPP